MTDKVLHLANPKDLYGKFHSPEIDALQSKLDIAIDTLEKTKDILEPEMSSDNLAVNETVENIKIILSQIKDK